MSFVDGFDMSSASSRYFLQLARIAFIIIYAFKLNQRFLAHACMLAAKQVPILPPEHHLSGLREVTQKSAMSFIYYCTFAACFRARLVRQP
jgi:hypothetical protein